MGIQCTGPLSCCEFSALLAIKKWKKFATAKGGFAPTPPPPPDHRHHLKEKMPQVEAGAQEDCLIVRKGGRVNFRDWKLIFLKTNLRAEVNQQWKRYWLKKNIVIILQFYWTPQPCELFMQCGIITLSSLTQCIDRLPTRSGNSDQLIGLPMLENIFKLILKSYISDALLYSNQLGNL